jgi:hypothetical protein
MSLRTLPKHRTEASYANQTAGDLSSRAVKHKQATINRFNRAIRRSQREVIAKAQWGKAASQLDLPYWARDND